MLLFLLLFNHQVVPDSLKLDELQQDRLLCPLLSPRVCSNSCPLSRWCHPTIPFCATSFSLWLQSFQISGSFPVSWLFTSGGQCIAASGSTIVLSMNIQGWFSSLGLTDLISLLSKGLSTVFSNTTVQKHQFFNALPSYWSSSHIHTHLLEKPWLWL